jgi:hypothetical protein
MPSPWVYPRQARDIKRGRPQDEKSNVQKTSMCMHVADCAADVRMVPSWAHKGENITVPSKLSLCDGECRRESFIMRNMSDTEVGHFLCFMF